MHLPHVTNNLLNLRPSTKGKAEAAPFRCDVCAELVTEPASHVRACLDHELTMFAVGRRAS